MPQGRRGCSPAIVLPVRELNIFELFQEPHMLFPTISNISLLSFHLGDQQFQLVFFFSLLSKGIVDVLSGVGSFMVLLDPCSNL